MSDAEKQATDVVRCEGICLTGYDIGIPGSGIAYPHPDCPAHGDDWVPGDNEWSRQYVADHPERFAVEADKPPARPGPTMSDGIRWESPPAAALGDGTKRGRPVKHASTRDALIAASGSWARVEDHLTMSGAQTLTSRINHGQRQWAGHDWSARYDVSPVGEGWSVWVRHNQPNP